MPRVEIRAGAVIDTIDQDEMRQALAEASAIEYERLRGMYPLRLPIITGTPASSKLTMGGDTGQGIATPAEGYVWSVVHLVIEGLTAAASNPDTMNVLRGPRIVWQLNGNQFCQTFGLGRIILQPGETLTYQNSGNLAATGLIIAHGLAWNVPAEMIGKIA